MMRRANKSKSSQKGMALVLALLIVFVLSAAAAALVFSTQTDVMTTANYNYLTQARYLSEAGAQAAVNWLMAYTVLSNPCSSSVLNCNTYPISETSNSSQGLVLTTDPNVTQYFPLDSAAQANFSNYMSSLPSLTSSIPGAKFIVTAQLVSVPEIAAQWSAGTTETQWKITSTGQITGAASAWHPVSVQLVETLEFQPVTPTFKYGAFATGTGCNTISMYNSAMTDSYASGWPTPTSGNNYTSYSSGNAGSGGNVGSNGSIEMTNSATINGTYSSPDTTTGNCSSGGDAAVLYNSATITGGSPIKLGAAVVYPAPTVGTPGTTATTLNNSSTGTLNPDASPGTPGVTCPCGAITLNNSAQLTLDPGTTAAGSYTYTIASLTMNNSSQLILKVVPGQTIVLNVASSGSVTLNNSASAAGSALAPEQLVINYPGSNGITLNNSTTANVLINAPNAPITFNNGAYIAGAVVGKTITLDNSGGVHYDASAVNYSITANRNYLLSFSWNKY